MPPLRPSVDDAAVPDRTDVAELIKLGRDREAAALGSSITNQGGHMDALAQLDQLGPVLGEVFGGLTPADLDKPTPCENFTVRGVLEHMVGGATMFAAAFRGQEPGELPSGEVLDQIGVALGDLMDAIHAPGALEGTIAAPFGEIPRETFARFVVLDGLVHGWDISTATGRGYEPPDTLVAEADEIAKQLLDPLRDGDTFKTATTVPASATPIERLAAYTGRAVPGAGR
jgi:uncharacterized protein (TIGR03086 family)